MEGTNGQAQPKVIGKIEFAALSDGRAAINVQGELNPLMVMQLVGMGVAQLATMFQQQKQSPLVLPSGAPIPNLKG